MMILLNSYCKMARVWVCFLLLLWSRFHRYCWAAPVACQWYPSADYEDVSMLCSGRHVSAPPRLLPPTLQWLQLQHTALRTLDSATFQFRRLPLLSRLSITGGHLTRVERRALCSLPALAAVDLSNNRLSELDRLSFDCNSQLQRLDLSGNPSLHRLPELSSSSISTLDVQHCRISDVDATELEGLPSLRVLYLDGNPELDCSSVRNKLSKKHTLLTVICDDRSQRSSLRSSNSNNENENQKPSLLKHSQQLLGISSETFTTISPQQLGSHETSPPISYGTTVRLTYYDYLADSEATTEKPVENTITSHSDSNLGVESKQFTTVPAPKKFGSIKNIALLTYNNKSSASGLSYAMENIIQSKATTDTISTVKGQESKQHELNSAIALSLNDVDKQFLFIMVILIFIIIILIVVIISLKRTFTKREHYFIPDV